MRARALRHVPRARSRSATSKQIFEGAFLRAARCAPDVSVVTTLALEPRLLQLPSLRVAPLTQHWCHMIEFSELALGSSVAILPWEAKCVSFEAQERKQLK